MKYCIWINDFFSLRDFFATRLISCLTEEPHDYYIFLTSKPNLRSVINNLNHTNIYSILVDQSLMADITKTHSHYCELKGRFAEVNNLPHNQIYRNYSKPLQEDYRSFFLFKNGLDLIQESPKSKSLYTNLYNKIHNSLKYVNKALVALLKGIKPDFLLICRTHLPETAYFTKAAAMLKIPVGGIISSWDHPTTHGPVGPGISYFACASEQIKEEMIKYENLATEQVTTLGKIQMDHFFEKDSISDKDQFLEKIGLKKGLKLITLATNVKGLKRHEKKIAEILCRFVRESGKNIGLCIRCHPLDKDADTDFGTLQYDSLVVLSQSQNYTTDPFSKEDQATLANLIHHSSIVIQTRGSIALDALALNTPVISLAFELDNEIEEGDRIVHEYDYAHYREIAQSWATWMVHSEKELFQAMTTYLETPQLHNENRHTIREKFVGPVDGKSAERTVSWLKQVSKQSYSSPYSASFTESLDSYFKSIKSEIEESSFYISQLNKYVYHTQQLSAKNRQLKAKNLYLSEKNAILKNTNKTLYNLKDQRDSKISHLTLKLKTIIENNIINEIWNLTSIYKSIYIFGAGKNTRTILKVIGPELCRKLQGLIDDKLSGHKLQNLNITNCKGSIKPDCVIISSVVHKNEMIKKCQQEFGSETHIVHLGDTINLHYLQ